MPTHKHCVYLDFVLNVWHDGECVYTIIMSYFCSVFFSVMLAGLVMETHVV